MELYSRYTKKRHLQPIDILRLAEDKQLYYDPEIMSLLMYLHRVQKKNLQWVLLNENAFKNFITSDRIDLIINITETGMTPSTTITNGNCVEYMDNYSRHTREILKLGKGHLVIAGGFVTKYGLYLCNKPIYENTIRKDFHYSDVDFFFVGIEPTCRYMEYQTSFEVEKILDSIFNYFKNSREKYTITKSDFAISIVTGEGKVFQFILRLYPRDDMVIGSFDMDPCQGLIEYKNNIVEMKCTLSYAVALKTLLFPVDITNYSVSWRHRIKKYANLAFYPLFPHIKYINHRFQIPDGGIFGKNKYFTSDEFPYSDYEGLIHICQEEQRNTNSLETIVNANCIRFIANGSLIHILHSKYSFESIKEKMIARIRYPGDTILGFFIKSAAVGLLSTPQKLCNQAIEKLKVMKEPKMELVLKTPKIENMARPFTPINKSEQEWYEEDYDPLCIKTDRETEMGWLLTLQVIKNSKKDNQGI